jgi:hypothetical protein
VGCTLEERTKVQENLRINTPRSGWNHRQWGAGSSGPQSALGRREAMGLGMQVQPKLIASFFQNLLCSSLCLERLPDASGKLFAEEERPTDS